uniref:CBS domain-containing protein n=1 Tax=Desulfobacca acetoxidans TaxID=60893 RepID=A0A7V4G7X8_9BACT
MKVRDIMVKELATLDINDELSLANDIMRLGRIRHLPVLEGETLVGIISERDLFRSSLAQALGYGDKGSREVMKTLRIKDVMVKQVVSVSPDLPLKDAVVLMVERKIGCLPVVEGGKLVGLITETDILMQYCRELGGCATAGPET